MQVLLLKDVEGLGQAGDIKSVAGGYAKNYLFPHKLALPATKGAIAQSRTLREAAKRRRERELTEAKALAAKLEGQVLSFKVRAGEGDRLYGSITNSDIAQGLAQATGIEIDRRNIDLEHSIKELGEHEIAIKLGSGVTATIRVQVERSDE